MLTTYPGTITDLFELFEKPLERWWPGTLPSEIDPRFELLCEGALDEQVIEFLLEYKLPAEATLQDIQVILDNQLMINILNVARNAYSADPVGASGEYAAIRQYVITHPWTASNNFVGNSATCTISRSRKSALSTRTASHSIQRCFFSDPVRKRLVTGIARDVVRSISAITGLGVSNRMPASGAVLAHKAGRISIPLVIPLF